MTERYDVNSSGGTNGVTASEDDQLLAAAGASGAKTSTIAAGAADNIAQMAALRAAGNTLTINVPTGTADPVGRPVDTQLQPSGGGTGGNGLQAFVYRRVVNGTEPASYTWTCGGSPVHAGAAGGILSFSGVDNTNPIVADGGQ